MEWDWVINYRKLFTSIVVLFFIHPSFGQITDRLEDEDISAESTEVNEELHIKLRVKLDLNDFLNEHAIYSLYITELQHQEILKHIVNTGKIIDLLELQSTGIISYAEYLQLKQIIKIKENNSIDTKTNISINNRNTYQSDIDKSYVGGHWGNYQQIKYTTKHSMSLGLAREIDIGECKSIIHPDHTSMYIAKKWKNKSISLGAFQVYQGFGLLLGQGYASSYGNGGINNYIQYRWIPNANLSEINYFNGINISKQFRNTTVNLAYSNQKIDNGTATGLHRTLNELSKKDKIKEECFLFGIDNNLRKLRTQFLLVSDSNFRLKGYSIAYRYFLKNMLVFGEISNYNQKLANTTGLLILLTKDIPISIAYTSFESNYKSPWQSYSIQGFTANDGKGLGVNIKIPFRRKWGVDYTYRFSNNIDYKEEYTQSIKFYQSVRIDKSLNKNIQIKNILIIQRSDAESNRIRSCLTIKVTQKEVFQHFYQLYLNCIEHTYSNALSYSLLWKGSSCHIIYSIGYFNAKSNNPIYYSIDNILQAKQSIGVFHRGNIQSLGVQYKVLNKIKLGVFILKHFNSIENTNSSKVTFSIKYH